MTEFDYRVIVAVHREGDPMGIHRISYHAVGAVDLEPDEEGHALVEVLGDALERAEAKVEREARVA